MATTGGATTRSWRWYGAAALASAVFPAVFVQATLRAHWYVEHPMIVPGDDSPGIAANAGNLLALPIFAVAAIACLMFPLLWGIAAFRTRKDAAVKGLPVFSTVLQGVALLVALPVATTLPYSWADVATLVAAVLIALWASSRDRSGRRTGLGSP
ncbi:hypothetical protein [Streptomyces olivochromogenes]|uniref:hypothetical protein n=1 Tax=Streptomyces olivochromogenes TaxID=1963 RepID=UPI001F1EE1A1|nr:hypothetical protein [Streptomyces olivochromogenes]MCF3136187.1 hypothetical protein [Streptomyces olivochromogenes]